MIQIMFYDLSNPLHVRAGEKPLVNIDIELQILICENGFFIFFSGRGNSDLSRYFTVSELLNFTELHRVGQLIPLIIIFNPQLDVIVHANPY